MKILIVNTFDRGGAANSCIRLHQGLLQEGVDSNLLVLNKTREIESCFQFKAVKKNSKPFFNFFKKVKRKLGKIYSLKFSKASLSKEVLLLEREQQGLEFYSFPDSPYDITTSKLYQEADVINLHWVAGFLDFESFFKKNKKPVIWTLHDMNAFTGGEHYSEILYSINDSGLPKVRVYSDFEKMVSKKNIKLKRSSLRDVKSMTIVSPSQWLKNESQNSSLFKEFSTHLIPYGLDHKVFKKRDKRFSRDFFNIPLNKKVVLFVADNIDNSRKGFEYLKKACESLERNDVILCSIGFNKPSINSSIQTLHLGEIKDDRIMSLVYSLSDVFVIPSLMDNLPNTVLESLLCGTPVIGFPVGGILDMIQNNLNGIISKDISVGSLEKSLNLFLEEAVEWSSEEISKNSLEKYALNIQAEKYIKLCNEILSTR
jgi:glycosyltransferase involved in cell wall biosynthesis